MEQNFDTKLLIDGFLEATNETVDSKTKRYVVERSGYKTDVCDFIGTMLLLRANPHTSTIEINGDYYDTKSFPIPVFMKELMNTAEIYLVEHSIDRAEPLCKAKFERDSFNPLQIEDYKFKPMTPRRITTFLLKDLKFKESFLTVKDTFTPIVFSELNCVCENKANWYKLGGALNEAVSTIVGLTLPSRFTPQLVVTEPASKEEVKKWILTEM